MSGPRIAVVVPARNAADWIEDTLRSVVAQTVPSAELELIVVDDGSTDDTPQIVRRLAGKSALAWRVHRNDGVAGPAAARNRGWRDSRAPWIQFLDADDLLAPEKIAHQLGLAESAPDNVAVVYSPWSRILRSGDRWVRTDATRPIIGADSLRDLLAPDNFIATGSQIFRRVWLERVGGYMETYRILEDVDLLIRIAAAGGGFMEAPSADALFCYRRHPTSSSRQSRLAFAQGVVRNAGAAERHWRDAGGISPARSRFLADMLFDAARVMASEQDPGFDAVAGRIQTLSPGFRPKSPVLLSALSRMLGYRRAELLSVRYRTLKRALGIGAS